MTSKMAFKAINFTNFPSKMLLDILFIGDFWLICIAKFENEKRKCISTQILSLQNCFPITLMFIGGW